MSIISANELRVRGVATIEEGLAEASEAIITVRGKPQFVVMDLSRYQYLKICELEATLAESFADMAAGRFVVETPEAHLAGLVPRD